MKRHAMWVSALVLALVCFVSGALVIEGLHRLSPDAAETAASELVGWGAGLAALVLLLAVAALAWSRRRRWDLEASLSEERTRNKMLSEDAWRSAWLGQMMEELRLCRDRNAMLQTATAALGSVLGASRTVFYESVRGGALVVRAQHRAPGTPPLGDSASLPRFVATDRELAGRLSSLSDLAEESDPEVLALAHRLGARSLLVAPVVADDEIRLSVLTVQQCDGPRGWTASERRFVERFAETVSGTLEQIELEDRRARTAEVRAGLLQVAQALSAARESDAVVDLAATVGAALVGSRRSVLFASSEGEWQAAAQHGLDEALSRDDIAALESSLDDVLRDQAPMHLEGRSLAPSREPIAFGRLLLMPVIYGRERLGVFAFEWSEEEAGGDRGADTEVAELVAELTASSLKNARLFEALSSSEARYADLYDNAPDMYQTLDEDGRILDCNLTECRTLGYGRQELVGRDFESLIARESVTSWKGAFRRLFDEGVVRDVSVKLQSKGGRTVDALVNASTIPASDRAPVSARMVLRDVTRIRQLEQQLHHSQKLEVVGALAGGIAHDFNNVLSGILGYASLLRRQLKDRPLTTKYLKIIERSAVRGAELTGRLLAASKRTPARQHVVNLNQVVDETVELLVHTISKNIHIEKKLDSRIRPLVADSGQLQQVVLNLCVNARDAMPEGGRLTVSTELEASEEWIRLSVEDSGVGMDPVIMERLFEPFFTTKGDSGTGLGLSVVYGIVRSLGGDVRVGSAPGKGARFDIHLPARGVAEELRASDGAEPVAGRGELILLVDDESVLRELGKDMLEAHGYRVQAVASGEEALHFLRETDEPVALVILDLVMPGLDGHETYRRLRSLDATLPILISSGLSREDAVRELLAEDATGFVPKPFAIGELTHAVSAALRAPQPPTVH